jgi:uncharacterized NAD(P)/FAD-binding protein YdhS
MDAERVLRVAIVGLGPKGLFALERLLDHASRLDAAIGMHVDVFEAHPVPGPGPNYDTGQPGYLRMNFAADQLDMWWPGSGIVPAGERRSFVAWRADRDGGDDDYPARAQAGRYLAEGFETLCRHLPANVALRLRRETVEAAEPADGGWLLRAAGAADRYDEVLLAVGHQGTSGVFPVEHRLSREAVPPGASVAIRGFALTFIDATLALTEGRGGFFEPLDHPYRLRYVPGEGDAAVIFPFSRSGRPMQAKPGNAIEVRVPALGRIAAQGRRRIEALRGTVDLHGDLLPIFAALACVNLAAASGRGDDRSLRVALGRRLAEAVGGVDVSDERPPAAAIEQSLAVGSGIAEPDVPWALGHTWRALYPAIVSRLGGDGLAESDWPAFLRLSAEMERIAFGPPALNAAKLLALIEAGRVDLTHVRGGRVAGADGRTALRSENGRQEVDAVIDAVLPGPGARGHAGLLEGLVTAGHARIPAGRRGLDVAADATCRGRDGRSAGGLAAVGRPSEDSVIGNDTLSRSLHPQADRWARRVAERCRDDFVAAARAGRRRAPA